VIEKHEEVIDATVPHARSHTTRSSVLIPAGLCKPLSGEKEKFLIQAEQAAMKV
jgi:hypothetical protein